MLPWRTNTHTHHSPWRNSFTLGFWKLVSFVDQGVADCLRPLGAALVLCCSDLRFRQLSKEIGIYGASFSCEDNSIWAIKNSRTKLKVFLGACLAFNERKDESYSSLKTVVHRGRSVRNLLRVCQCREVSGADSPTWVTHWAADWFSTGSSPLGSQSQYSSRVTRYIHLHRPEQSSKSHQPWPWWTFISQDQLWMWEYFLVCAGSASGCSLSPHTAK